MKKVDDVAGAPAAGHRVVPRGQWLRERIDLLNAEKMLTKQRDALAERVRQLPWVRVEQNYTFDSPRGPVTLDELFGPHAQLIVYHFMFDPTWSQGCASCSFIADHYNSLLVHLAHRDISFVTVSRAPVEMLETFRQRMGWTFPWVSAARTEFSRDFGVSFTDEELADPSTLYNYNRRPYPIRELPGLSVFTRTPDREIYHTYSVYARGLEDFLTAYRFIDITPRGRDEAKGQGMGWLRHHDRYDQADFVVPWMERPGVTSPVIT